MGMGVFCFQDNPAVALHKGIFRHDQDVAGAGLGMAERFVGGRQRDGINARCQIGMADGFSNGGG
jgi:hypothetical protein